MKTLQLDIDGFIGEWGYSKSFVKNFLAAAGKDPVTVRISSLGGDIDHAISICDQFTEQGNVTVILSAFNASAATLISLGARRIIMNSNSFYLIHKALTFVESWGNMNEDDIDTLISQLTKDKNELEKVTLVLARMYAAKCKTKKKTTGEILTLMKQETWLTAEEALAWGFVDEIAEPAVKENLLSNNRLVTMLNYSDLPLPIIHEPSSKDIPGMLLRTEDPTPGILSTLKKFINSIFIMKQFKFLNTLLSVPLLETSDEGIYLNEAQAELINSALEANEQIVTERDEAIASRDAAIVGQEAAVSDRVGIEASLDAIDPSIASATTIETKIQAIRTFMASKPAVIPVGVVTPEDLANQQETESMRILNALPHMQED